MGVDGERGVRNRLEQVQLPYLEYLNGQTLSAPDNTALTIPVTASCVEIAAEDGACYWNIGGVATVNSSSGVRAFSIAKAAWFSACHN